MPTKSVSYTQDWRDWAASPRKGTDPTDCGFVTIKTPHHGLSFPFSPEGTLFANTKLMTDPVEPSRSAGAHYFVLFVESTGASEVVTQLIGGVYLGAAWPTTDGVVSVAQKKLRTTTGRAHAIPEDEDIEADSPNHVPAGVRALQARGFARESKVRTVPRWRPHVP